MIKHIIKGPKGGRQTRYEFEVDDYVEWEHHGISPMGRKKFAAVTYRGRIIWMGECPDKWQIDGTYCCSYIDERGNERKDYIRHRHLRPQKHFRSRLVIDELAKATLEAI